MFRHTLNQRKTSCPGTMFRWKFELSPFGNLRNLRRMSGSRKRPVKFAGPLFNENGAWDLSFTDSKQITQLASTSHFKHLHQEKNIRRHLVNINQWKHQNTGMKQNGKHRGRIERISPLKAANPILLLHYELASSQPGAARSNFGCYIFSYTATRHNFNAKP